ncbi:MAG: PEP-CTERM sorting domain-containing protein [Terriglobales bacterium]
MNDGAIRKTVRRRRSWYRRRLRFQRTLAVVVVGTALAGACWQNAARYFSFPSLHASQVLPDSFWTRGNVRKDLALMAARSAKPTKFLARIPNVYPYSVVPGGVTDPDDLRYAALRDYVVRRHYARFDYSHARLVRATEAREVYLSYRVRDSIFWTRRRIRLHLGELLLTDGKITARARCGNQISDAAKPEVSEEEPAEDVLDQPVAQIEPAPSLPIRPVLAPPDLPGGEPIAPKLFAGGFFFPYVPVGVPIPSGVCPKDDVIVDGHCRPKRHRHPVVPEPSTMVLIGSGLALILWRYRRTARPVAA